MKLIARSKQRFPSLAPVGCPWHEDCTPMDCEFHRSVPSLDQYQRPGSAPGSGMDGLIADVLASPPAKDKTVLRLVNTPVPIKKSKRKR